MPASLHNNVITGDGLQTLQSIFNDWCHAHHITSNHPSAKEAAGRLLDWYQLGITEQTQLARLIAAG